MRMTSEQRNALKAALRAAIPASDPRRATISSLSKEDLFALARDVGIDVLAAIAGGGESAADALAAVGVQPDDAAPIDRPADTVQPADAVQKPTPEKVADLVRRTLEPMGAGDMGEFQGRLTLLAERALTRHVQTVEKVVEKIVVKQVGGAPPPGCGPAHFPTVVDRQPMGLLFDPAACGTKITQRLDVAVWDAPDAPPVDDGYVWPAKITGQLLTQIRREHPVMLTGPAGTGKTSWVEQVAARLKRPYVRIQCNRTTDAAELVGMTVPGGASGTRWQDGQLTAAVRRPGTLIAVEEPSVCRPGALLAFQSLMDGGRALHIAETGEVVPLAEGVCFVWADNTAGSGDENGAYAGTQQLNRSTIDRLGVMVLFDYMPRDNEVRAVVSRTGCTPALAGAAVDFAARTRADTSAGRLTHGVGIRRLIALAELITDGVPVHDAFEAAIYRGASPDDRESLRQIWAASVVASEWEKAAHG